MTEGVQVRWQLWRNYKLIGRNLTAYTAALWLPSLGGLVLGAIFYKSASQCCSNPYSCIRLVLPFHPELPSSCFTPSICRVLRSDLRRSEIAANDDMLCGCSKGPTRNCVGDFVIHDKVHPAAHANSTCRSPGNR